jgi:hypothetical protein
MRAFAGATCTVVEGLGSGEVGPIAGCVVGCGRACRHGIVGLCREMSDSVGWLGREGSGNVLITLLFGLGPESWRWVRAS